MIRILHLLRASGSVEDNRPGDQESTPLKSDQITIEHWCRDKYQVYLALDLVLVNASACVHVTSRQHVQARLVSFPIPAPNPAHSLPGST